MEDVKEPRKVVKELSPSGCFNPCFNGRCKRTLITNANQCELVRKVSILVLMEDVKELIVT